MLDTIRDWDIMDVIKECEERGLKYYTVRWEWPERLEQSANVCFEYRKFGPLKDMQLSWNRAKSIVIPIVRGERKPRTDSEKVVESQASRLQNYLKFEPKSATKVERHRSSVTNRAVASGVSKFEMIRCQSLDSGAEKARSLRTHEVQSLFKQVHSEKLS